MIPRPRVGVLGGTFDPIHNGHLVAARAAQQTLQLDTVRFIPSARPPHRHEPPRASGYDRLAMVRLAIDRAAGWEASDLEMRRDGPSYTSDTLASLHREGLSPLQIFFITGADAFAEIATWHRYPEVLDAAHFVVVTRPGISLDLLRARTGPAAERLASAREVAHAATPCVVLVEADTPEVSSTEIRRRAAAGESLETLVPPAVAAYISHNSLYRGAATAPSSSRPSTPDAPVGR